MIKLVVFSETTAKIHHANQSVYRLLLGFYAHALRDFSWLKTTKAALILMNVINISAVNTGVSTRREAISVSVTQVSGLLIVNVKTWTNAPNPDVIRAVLIRRVHSLVSATQVTIHYQRIEVYVQM